MSEFACRNGHLMSPGQLSCYICGEPMHTMDGKTDAELRAEERYENEDEEE